jgi:hypothetical protein
VDVDLTANTDCEDLLVFAADVVEFVEQDKAFLLDAITDSSLLFNSTGALFFFETFFLLQLRKQPLSVLLAKFFNA